MRGINATLTIDPCFHVAQSATFIQLVPDALDRFVMELREFGDRSIRALGGFRQQFGGQITLLLQRL